MDNMLFPPQQPSNSRSPKRKGRYLQLKIIEKKAG
jgi:hypothetical protein